MRDLIDTITPWFAEWGLLIVFLATMIESSIVVASILPGETVLLAGGFFASPSALDMAVAPLDLTNVILVGFAGAVVGDLVGYVIGRAAGRSIIRRFGRFFFLPERRLPVLERYFASYGRRAILFGRFAPFLRSIRTLVAGTAQMPFWRFVLPDLLGAAVWVVAIASTGFLLGESWKVADRYLGAGGIFVFLLLGVLFFLSWRGMRARVERELSTAGPAPQTEGATSQQPPSEPSVDRPESR